MTKRARGSVRPGQRRPIRRRGAGTAGNGAAATPAAAAQRPSSSLTEAEAQRAAELEAQLLAEERAAEAARKRQRERAGREVLAGGGLALRAQDEYAYVARDVKRIVRVASILLVILFALWILIEGAGIIPVG